MDTQGLVVIVPVLGRPHRARPVAESIRAATPTARILFVTTDGDTETITAVDATDSERLTLPPRPSGDYATKINTAIRSTTEPLVFTGADDLHWHPGWYEKALTRLTPGVGVVGVNDLGSSRVHAGQHATHFLITRNYADLGTIDGQPGVFHEGYHHFFCDDELVATARYRGAWAMATDAIVEHLHPYYAKAPRDATYDHGCAQSRKDGTRHAVRRHLWRP